MPRTQIPVVPLSRAGTAPAGWVPGDPVNGMYFAGNQGNTILEVWRNDPLPGTVGIAFGAIPSVDGVSLPDKTFLVPAGGTRLAGPYPTQFYNQFDLSVSVDPPLGATLFRAYSIG